MDDPAFRSLAMEGWAVETEEESRNERKRDRFSARNTICAISSVGHVLVHAHPLLLVTIPQHSP
jgi:hypothetical protein